MTEFHHISVLLDECIEGLNIKPDGIYVDGTLGGAGHSSEIAKRLTTGRLIGIDRDPVALKAAGERLAPFGDRVTLVHSNFCEIAQVLKDLEIEGVDGILLDLGVSSPQLDDGSRGFSYMADAPLDMRMNNEDALSAYDGSSTITVRSVTRPGSPLPSAAAGNRNPSKPRWNLWISSAAPCLLRHCVKSSILPSAVSRPSALRSTMNWAVWKRS